jgi:hypothetical protein
VSYKTGFSHFACQFEKLYFRPHRSNLSEMKKKLYHFSCFFFFLVGLFLSVACILYLNNRPRVHVPLALAWADSEVFAVGVVFRTHFHAFLWFCYRYSTQVFFYINARQKPAASFPPRVGYRSSGSPCSPTSDAGPPLLFAHRLPALLLLFFFFFFKISDKHTHFIISSPSQASPPRLAPRPRPHLRRGASARQVPAWCW